MFVSRRALRVALLSMSTLYSVATQAVELQGVLGVGANFGGETLLSGVYTDGVPWSVAANAGLGFHAGAVFVLGPFETQATAGYISNGTNATNGKVAFGVVPLEVIEFIHIDRLRFGFGIAHLTDAKLSFALPDGTKFVAKLDSTIGTIVQIGWVPDKSRFSFDLRYLKNKYKESGVTNSPEYRGDSLGISTSLYF
jgi:hypothetical protein